MHSPDAGWLVLTTRVTVNELPEIGTVVHAPAPLLLNQMAIVPELGVPEIAVATACGVI